MAQRLKRRSFVNVSGRTDARTDDGRKVITIAHPEHSSGELKNAASSQKAKRPLKENSKNKTTAEWSVVKTIWHALGSNVVKSNMTVRVA